MGSPISPLARGQDIDGRTDVFAFGVLLYEIVTGVRPFVGETTQDVLTAVMRDEPKLASEVNPLVPAELDWVLEHCLGKLRDARYANGQELLDALTLVLPKPRISEPASGRKATGASTVSILTPGASAVGRERNSRRWWSGAWRTAAIVGASKRRPALAAGLLIALCVGALMVVKQTTAPAAKSVGAMLAPAALEAGIGTAGLRFVDVPPSHTSVPAAEAAYRRGMRELAGGSWGTAEDLFLEAEAADPDFASAHLQLALAASGTCPPDLKLARHAFAEAQRTRDRLAARDQEVLAAIAPAILDPPNLAEEAARFQALAVRRPLDAQVWDMLGNAENKLFHFDASARAVAIEARVDQTQTDGYLVWAQDTESRPEAERIIDECLRHDDVAPGCRVERMELQSTSGSCQAMEDEARTLAALSPASYVGPSMLARALADEGASVSAVSLALEDVRSRLSERDRPRIAAIHEAKLALWTGDFARGLQVLDALIRGMDVPDSALESLRIEARWESGDRIGGGQLALASVQRAAALPLFERPEEDPQMGILSRACASGVLQNAECRRRREDWIANWRHRLDEQAWKAAGPVVWAVAFAPPTSVVDAVDAAKRRPDFGPLPAIGSRQLLRRNDGAVGEMLRLAGQLGDAMPYLEAGADQCSYEMARVQARLGLGLAREQRGDQEGACASFKHVLEQWGNAKPRSVTADTAREHAKALSCPH